MGAGAGELTGPDFAAGVAAGDVKDGVPLLGHAGGEAVVLVRRGEQVHAVGASCSHYGGPLAEGMVEGDTIHCPWHHACFDLKSGAALAAPGLSPIACWEVEQKGSLVRVGEKRPAQLELPTAGARTAPAPKAIVIVGAGAAGHAAAERLRALGYAGTLTLVGADEAPPVDRPNLSKDYLAGNAPEEWIPLRPPEVYAERRIELVTATPATGVDVDTHQVTLADGRTLAYDRLLLATGAEPVRLNVPGAERTHVHTLRTLADSRAIVARAATARHAVVIGASFIGLEAAASLRARGLEVRVVAPDERPLERVLGPELGAFVRGLHEAKGVKFHLGKGVGVASIGDREVTLTSGAKLPAELVVVGIGVRPSTALADQAKLRVDRGIVVDAELRASAPDVFAAGDVARFPDASGQMVRIEHWVVAQRMGQTAAHNLLGEQRRFDAVPFFWSAHYDVTLAYVGHAEAWDAIEVHGSLEARDATVAYRRGGKTLAVVTVGRDRVSLEAELALARADEAALAAFGSAR